MYVCIHKPILEASRVYVAAVRSVFKISNLFLRPRLWQFEI